MGHLARTQTLPYLATNTMFVQRPKMTIEPKTLKFTPLNRVIIDIQIQNEADRIPIILFAMFISNLYVWSIAILFRLWG